METLDINLARGAVLILLILGFLGIWAWAWSKKRQPAFREASMLPLEEDQGVPPQSAARDDGAAPDKIKGTKE